MPEWISNEPRERFTLRSARIILPSNFRSIGQYFPVPCLLADNGVNAIFMVASDDSRQFEQRNGSSMLAVPPPWLGALVVEAYNEAVIVEFEVSASAGKLQDGAEIVYVASGSKVAGRAPGAQKRPLALSVVSTEALEPVEDYDENDGDEDSTVSSGRNDSAGSPAMKKKGKCIVTVCVAPGRVPPWGQEEETDKRLCHSVHVQAEGHNPMSGRIELPFRPQVMIYTREETSSCSCSV